MSERQVNTMPISFEEEMKKELEALSSQISGSSGDKIKCGGAMGFSTPDGEKGKTIHGVIIAWTTTKFYYGGRPYKEDSPQPPVCFSIGPNISMLTPSSNSPEPQAETCSACPRNQFKKGAGKECREHRLLAIAPYFEESLDVPPIWVMKVPPKSLSFFDDYVRKVKALQGTVPKGVITEISQDSDTIYSAPRFRAIRKLSDDELKVYYPLTSMAVARLAEEPDVSKLSAT